LTVLALTAGVLAFVALLKLLGAAEAGGEVLRTARGAATTLTSAELGDDAKEAAARRAAVRLLRGFAALAGIGLAALAASGAIVWAGSAAGLYPLAAAIETASGLPFLAASSLLAVAAWVILERRR
jgi:hypothetical protein